MITNFREIPFGPSNFLKPVRVQFEENGIEKTWDIVESHDSVSTLIVNTETNTLILVKQFRPAVKHANPKSDGYMYELCAGIVDKDKPLKQIAIEECLEECGYKVNPDNIQEYLQVHSMTGLIGAKQTWFMADVTNADKVSEGGGICDEQIEVIELEATLEAIGEFLLDKTKKKTAGLIAMVTTVLTAN